jgi:hypothetical protein
LNIEAKKIAKKYESTKSLGSKPGTCLNISNISPKIDTFVAIKNKRSAGKGMLALVLDSC